VDNYSVSSSQGFYLNAKMNMTIKTTGLADGPTLNKISFSQSFATSPVTSSSNSFSFYYTNPISTVPNNVSLSSFGIALNTSNFKKISGINVLFSTPEITIDCSASNMGTYFYRNPLLTYTCKVNGTTVATKNESDLTNVNKQSYYPDNVLKPAIRFNSKFNTGSLATSYATQLYLSVVANNIFGSTSTSPASTTQNVIVDGPSNTLVYSTLSQSIPILGTNTAGYRVWSAPSYQNNCPYLTKDNNGTTYYKSIQYNNEWDITSSSSTPGNYNVTTELLVSNGLFRTPGSGGYINYSTYLHNTLNYSGISSATGEIRFATFCWKLSQRSNSYSNLSFTINSITPTPTTNSSGLLLINSRRIQVLYFFQDESQTSTFSSTVFNSVWIDGNSNNNGVGSTNFYNTINTYGYYGGIDSAKGVVISGTNATINVFIPTINPVNNTTYLYLRLAIPMDVSISFGNVSATIS
jgi:hypothetical protein